MRLSLALLLLAFGAPAQASGGAAAAMPAVAPHVDVYPFAAPIVHEGRLVNYVFVQLRLHGTATADGPTLKQFEPRLRDAIVREAHRSPFVVPGDANHVDDRRLTAFALAEGRRLAGPAAFASAEVRKQTPQRIRTSPARRTGS